MKAQDLLALVKESSKGTKHVDGEVKTPSYDNLNTPDNHVSGKGTKEVKNAKKDLGKRRDKKNPANPGTPRKKEKGREMGGPPKSYKRMNEQSPRSAEDVLMNAKRAILKSVQTMDRKAGTMTVAQRGGKPVTIQMDPETMKGALADVLGQIKRSQQPKEVQQIWGKFLQQAAQDQGNPAMKPQRQSSGHSVGKPMTPQKWMQGAHTQWGLADGEGDEMGPDERMGESYADTGSMQWKQTVKKGGPVSKTAKVRGNVDDEPTNKADPGKPKGDGKDVMGDGANLGKIMNPKTVKKVEEGLKGLEDLLGRKLKIKTPISEGLKPGVRVQITGGSGIDSDKTGVVVPPQHIKTDGRGVPVNTANNPYQPVDWSKEVAVQLDDGGLITMFKNRLVPLEEPRGKPSFNQGSMPVQEGMDPVLAQYLRTALWSSTDMNTDMPLNHDYDLDDFSMEALRQAHADLLKFKAALSNDLADELHMPSVAHDLWLVRNGHSRGFTDGDYSPEIGELMTKLALKMGKVTLVVGENNQIYFFKG